MPLGLLEIAAIVAMVLVWPAGIALAWLSSAWSQRDKLVATVLIPAAVFGLAMLPGVASPTHWWVLVVFLFVTPVVWSIGAIYLAIRLYQTRLGSPNTKARSGDRAGVLEIAAILLTPLFWPVGVILLWTSWAWNTRDKLIGSILPPGGYFGVAVLLVILRTLNGGSCTATSDSFGTVTSSCTTYGPPHWVQLAIVLVLLALPLCSATYLAVRLRGARLLKPALAS
jgi:hypothetical protein